MDSAGNLTGTQPGCRHSQALCPHHRHCRRPPPPEPLGGGFRGQRSAPQGVQGPPDCLPPQAQQAQEDRYPQGGADRRDDAEHPRPLRRRAADRPRLQRDPQERDAQGPRGRCLQDPPEGEVGRPPGGCPGEACAGEGRGRGCQEIKGVWSGLWRRRRGRFPAVFIWLVWSGLAFCFSW